MSVELCVTDLMDLIHDNARLEQELGRIHEGFRVGTQGHRSFTWATDKNQAGVGLANTVISMPNNDMLCLRRRWP